MDTGELATIATGSMAKTKEGLAQLLSMLTASAHILAEQLSFMEGKGRDPEEILTVAFEAGHELAEKMQGRGTVEQKEGEKNGNGPTND